MTNWDAIDHSRDAIFRAASSMEGGKTAAVERIIDEAISHMCWETLTSTISDEAAKDYARSAILEAVERDLI